MIYEALNDEALADAVGGEAEPDEAAQYDALLQLIRGLIVKFPEKESALLPLLRDVEQEREKGVHCPEAKRDLLPRLINVLGYARLNEVMGEIMQVFAD